MNIRSTVYAAVLLVASGIAVAQAPMERDRLEMMRERQTGGYTPLDPGSESAKAAARDAVAAQAAASGADLKLLSICNASAGGAAWRYYSISLIALKDGKPQFAAASLQLLGERAGGRYQLDRWSWVSDKNSIAAWQRAMQEPNCTRDPAACCTRPAENVD